MPKLFFLTQFSYTTRGHYYPPTILEVTPQMSIWREEVFGPVVVALPFDTEEEAIQLANDSPFGLAGQGDLENVI